VTPTDLIAGSEADSKFTIEVACPSCGAAHRVALTRLDGRFAFACGASWFSGQVSADAWTRIKAHIAAGGAAIGATRP